MKRPAAIQVGGRLSVFPNRGAASELFRFETCKRGEGCFGAGDLSANDECGAMPCRGAKGRGCAKRGHLLQWLLSLRTLRPRRRALGWNGIVKAKTLGTGGHPYPSFPAFESWRLGVHLAFLEPLHHAGVFLTSATSFADSVVVGSFQPTSTLAAGSAFFKASAPLSLTLDCHR